MMLTLLMWLQVISCVFQYLRMMREQGPERRLWEELNAVERNEFNYMEPVSFQYFSQGLSKIFRPSCIEHMMRIAWSSL